MLYAAVLAGGRSSRMGEDKAFLRTGTENLLERAVRVVKEAGAEFCIISGRETVQAGADIAVPDRVPHLGPPGALFSLLEYFSRQQPQALVQEDRLLIIPVDMPGLTPALLRGLVQAAGRARVAHYQGEIFPCVFRLSTALHALLSGLHERVTDSEQAEEAERQAGKNRQFSMRRLFEALDGLSVTPGEHDARVFANMNTPEDWRDFLSGPGLLR